MKKLFGHIKSFVDIWKVWIFFAALLFGTNGAQMYANSGEKPTLKAVQSVKPATKPLKTTIIHKVDNSYCDRKIAEHENGSRH